jgi:hypothetical protein
MRRELLFVLLLVSCKKEQQATPAKGSGSAAPAVAATSDAAAPTADAPAPASINLLHAVPSTIRVSSRVNNKSIKPEHIADRSLDTAWSSVTGQLVGAWIEVSVDDADIEAVKLTVGHTGHGKKGEDYFTMNPRIRAVKIDDDGKPLGTYELDITKRELQTIVVKPAGTTMRITVTEIEPGSKKSWREVAVSELEVWGTPFAGFKQPDPAPEPNIEVFGEASTPPDPCAGIEEARVAFGDPRDRDSPGPGGDDHAYPPTCEELPMPANASTLSAPWSNFSAGCPVGDEIYGPKNCMLTFKSGNRTAEIQVGSSMAHDTIEVSSIEEEDVVAGGHRELVVTFKHRDGDALFLCADAPKLGCAGPYDDDKALNAAAAHATFATHVELIK